MSDPDCIFCKIVSGEIPSKKIFETNKIYAFMDVYPLSEGHCLVIPKKHARTSHEIDDNTLGEILLAIKKIVLALEIENYNILQNNGRIAHQAVMHAHFHIIPKPTENLGLGVIWKPIDDADQENIAEKIIKNLAD